MITPIHLVSFMVYWRYYDYYIFVLYYGYLHICVNRDYDASSSRQQPTRHRSVSLAVWFGIALLDSLPYPAASAMLICTIARLKSYLLLETRKLSVCRLSGYCTYHPFIELPFST